MAPVIHRLKAAPLDFDLTICVTAQHREMLDQVLEIFEITPDYDLNTMTPAQSLAQVTVRAVEGLDRVVEAVKPDVVLVQGDTTTALCGALVAYYHKVRVGHIEAGLRTADKFAPFPEEINRRLVTQLADYHFAPTGHSREALLQESVDDSKIFITGNTVIDALLWVREKVKKQRPAGLDDLALKVEGKEVVLVTGHRRESFGEGFENICEVIRSVSESFRDVAFIYPVHLNPNVREPVNRILSGHDRIHLIEPLPYEPFVWLMDRAEIVLTDSGGIQEEAPSLGKPVLVMRETTERPEGVEVGNARLVGTRKDSIERELSDLLNKPEKRKEMARINNPYGDGHAAERIVDILRQQTGE